MQSIPKENEIIWVHGFEFRATEVQVVESNGRKLLRFTGVCTGNPVNDSIRNTSYNGGRYGWRVREC